MCETGSRGDVACVVQEKDEQVQQAMDSQMAVAVGGYGHERPGSIGGAADLLDLALDHALSPSADRSAGKQGVARDAVSLEPDLPLQVLKEGWLLKQVRHTPLLEHPSCVSLSSLSLSLSLTVPRRACCRFSLSPPSRSPPYPPSLPHPPPTHTDGNTRTVEKAEEVAEAVLCA